MQICQHVMMTTAHTRQRGVERRFACPVGSFMLTTDAHRLSQILINLLTNAGKFTSEGSITLGVEIDEERGEVLLWAADTGPGIPPDKQGSGFQPLREARRQQEEGHGAGPCHLPPDRHDRRGPHLGRLPLTRAARVSSSRIPSVSTPVERTARGGGISTL